MVLARCANVRGTSAVAERWLLCAWLLGAVHCTHDWSTKPLDASQESIEAGPDQTDAGMDGKKHDSGPDIDTGAPDSGPTSCPEGKMRCDADLCADLSQDPDHCGSCTKHCAEPADHGHASCDGTCHISCDDSYRECSGGCFQLTDVNHCGKSCTKCLAPPNAHPTCNGSECRSECLYSTLSCSDEGSSCGSWNFESGTDEGWSLSSGGVPGSFAASTTRASEGSYALAAGVTSTLELKVPLCDLGKTTDLWTKRVTFQIYIAGPAIKSSNDNYIDLNVINPSGSALVVEQQNIETGKWFTFTGVFTTSITDLQKVSELRLSFRFYDTGVTNFSATAFIDDIRIQ